MNEDPIPTLEPPKPRNWLPNIKPREWVWLAAGLVLFGVTARAGAFGEFGYLAVATVFVTMAVFVIRNLAFTSTLDRDVDAGMHRAWFDSLTPQQKWASYLAVFCTLFIGLCILAAAILG